MFRLNITLRVNRRTVRWTADPRLQNVTPREGREARDHLIRVAREGGWYVTLHGRVGSSPRTHIPHVQFRRRDGERPYPFSLKLNPQVRTFYVRRPSKSPDALLQAFAGAHVNEGGEVKIPVADAATAKSIAEKFLEPVS